MMIDDEWVSLILSNDRLLKDGGVRFGCGWEGDRAWLERRSPSNHRLDGTIYVTGSKHWTGRTLGQVFLRSDLKQVTLNKGRTVNESIPITIRKSSCINGSCDVSVSLSIDGKIYDLFKVLISPNRLDRGPLSIAIILG
jgi:hypothetical protein